MLPELQWLFGCVKKTEESRAASQIRNDNLQFANLSDPQFPHTPPAPPGDSGVTGGTSSESRSSVITGELQARTETAYYVITAVNKVRS